MDTLADAAAAVDTVAGRVVFVRRARAAAYRAALAAQGIMLTGGEEFAAVDEWVKAADPDAYAVKVYIDKRERVAAATFPSFQAADDATKADMRFITAQAMRVLL